MPEAVESREVALLLACARTRMDDRSAARLAALLEERVAWEDLWGLAKRHGLGPLLYWRLRERGEGRVPPEILGIMHRHFQFHVVENMRLVEELVRLLDLFGQDGIRAIPWKGVALGLAAYGNLALRKAGDLDLLLHPGSVRQATARMLSLGYRITTPRKPNGLPADWDCYEFRFERPDGKATVELPWRIPPRSRSYMASLDFDRLWERRELLAGTKVPIPGLPAEEMLVCLCAHGARHYWDRLMWICDLAELIQARPALDWERVERQARALGNWRILCLGLLLAQETIQTAAPREIIDRARAEPTARRLADAVLCNLWKGVNGVNGRSGPYEDLDLRARSAYDRCLMERPVDITRYWLELGAARLVPTAKDRAVWSLPSSLEFLYYLVRPIRLLAHRGMVTLRTLSHGEESPKERI
jgi:hypothetical protein